MARNGGKRFGGVLECAGSCFSSFSLLDIKSDLFIYLFIFTVDVVLDNSVQCKSLNLFRRLSYCCIAVLRLTIAVCFVPSAMIGLCEVLKVVRLLLLYFGK